LQRSSATSTDAIAAQIYALDSALFSFLPEAQSTGLDRRALLALHAAAADRFPEFAYLEVGSYMGGSLQAVMRDPRCREVISIDPRTTRTPDARGTFVYEGNTTDRMLELLGALPDVDMNKLTTFDATTDTLSTSDLPVRPNYCFIDGEHTHDAVVRDARFCAQAIGGAGVIAFHDYALVRSAIKAFIRENWRDIRFALAFGGPRRSGDASGVLALEMGDNDLLKHPAIERAVGPRHSRVWRLTSRPRHSPFPFLLAWEAMPAIDAFVLRARNGHRHD
jgi:hypothetical protein